MGLQIRQGTDAQRANITPQSGELIYTTDTKEVYVGDGTTAGGIAVGQGANVTYGNANVTTLLASGNVTTITASGNITANYFIGDGSYLTNVGNVGNYGNANVAQYLPTYTGNLAGGNLNITTAITSNTATIANVTSANLTANIVTANTVSIVSLSANSATFTNITTTESNIAFGNSSYANGVNAIAIGVAAYANTANSIAIGTHAGQYSLGANIIAIGYGAGGEAGNNSISIGTWGNVPGVINQNSIAFNAANTPLDTFTPGFFAQPVREDNGNTTAQVFYNEQTAEFTYSKASSTTKTPVQAATTVSLYTLSTNGYTYYNGPANDGIGATITQNIIIPYDGPLVIDGVTMLAGYRVLLKDEIGVTSGGISPGLLTGKNGIYIVTEPGDHDSPWILERSGDFNESNEVADALVYVESGTVNARSSWRCTVKNTDVFVMGTTSANVVPATMQSLTTPASSSAPGITGQMVWDTNYIYVCVATNTWKRTALTTF